MRELTTIELQFVNGAWTWSGLGAAAGSGAIVGGIGGSVIGGVGAGPGALGGGLLGGIGYLANDLFQEWFSAK